MRGGTSSDGRRDLHAGFALVVVMVGVLMAAVDATIVVLALPEIKRSLHVSLGGATWVVIAYLLMITLLATQVGRLGDMFGRVRMYEAGFLVFIVGSALCALAVNEAMIVGFRVLQGVGGALMTANSGAVVADIFPPERRGRAYGFNAASWNVGAVLGILLGGVIVTYASWRWIFWINVPVGIVAFLLALRILHDSGERRRQPLDPWGMTTLGLGVLGVLWAMTKLASTSPSPPVDAALMGGVAMLALFVVVERTRRAPMLALSIFRIPTMTPTLLASFFQALANFSVLLLVIMYLQGARSYSPLDASLVLVPGYVIAGAVAPYSGRLADVVGPIWPATVGLGVQIVAFLLYANLGMTTPIWVVAVAAVINGVGSEGFFPANQAVVMKSAPPTQFGVASGMLRTFSNVGMVFSFSVAILVAGRTIPRRVALKIFLGTAHLSTRLAGSFAGGLRTAFYVSIAFMALAGVLSATRVIRLRRLSAKPEPCS